MESNEEKVGQPEMEQWLDAALRARADAEPRAGLEERVLARIASEPPSVGFHWWPMVSAVAAIVIFALALIIWRSNKPQPNVANGHQEPAKPASGDGSVEHKAPVVVAAQSNLQTRHRPGASKNAVCCLSKASSVAAAAGTGAKRERLPMLATFPAPSPQTAEERLLARLAAQRGSFDLAGLARGSLPEELSVPKLELGPMEGTPPDNPQE